MQETDRGFDPHKIASLYHIEALRNASITREIIDISGARADKVTQINAEFHIARAVSFRQVYKEIARSRYEPEATIRALESCANELASYDAREYGEGKYELLLEKIGKH